MKTLLRRHEVLLVLGLLSVGIFSSELVLAQIRPGEDPVTLTKRVSTMQLPDGGVVKSKPLDSAEMPASLRAKVARFEAKSKSGETTGFSSDKDVKRETSSDGFKKTCIQDVGSNTAASPQQPGRPGLASNQQIVVLRGDLVNICK